MSNPIHLTTERVRELLKEAVTERGEDHVYVKPMKTKHGYDNNTEGCNYVHTPEMDGRQEGGFQPGCLVGLVLHKAGLPLDELYARDHGDLAPSYLRQLEHRSLITFEDDVPDLLGRAQSRQDDGKPWGGAVRYALGEGE